jgi:hypothetical protein
MTYLLVWIGMTIGFCIGRLLLGDTATGVVSASFYCGMGLLCHWLQYGRHGRAA